MSLSLVGCDIDRKLYQLIVGSTEKPRLLPWFSLNFLTGELTLFTNVIIENDLRWKKELFQKAFCF